MRILFFVHRYWPSVGGVEKYIFELARSLMDGGHAVTVVAGDHIGSLPVRESTRVSRSVGSRRQDRRSDVDGTFCECGRFSALRT